MALRLLAAEREAELLLRHHREVRLHRRLLLRELVHEVRLLVLARRRRHPLLLLLPAQLRHVVQLLLTLSLGGLLLLGGAGQAGRRDDAASTLEHVAARRCSGLLATVVTGWALSPYAERLLLLLLAHGRVGAEA